MKNILTYVICVVLVEACGFGVGMLTREGTAIYRDTIVKPTLSPAPIVFPIALLFNIAYDNTGESYGVWCAMNQISLRLLPVFWK
ncbi:MAG: hypothetical protein IJT96_00560 [Lachnospiraceae bacterium]|nr:hypothetical protein [Lachnospiraceae bacterium]